MINLIALTVAIFIGGLVLLWPTRKPTSCTPQDILIKPGETITIVGRDGSVIHVTGEQ